MDTTFCGIYKTLYSLTIYEGALYALYFNLILKHYFWLFMVVKTLYNFGANYKIPIIVSCLPIYRISYYNITIVQMSVQFENIALFFIVVKCK